MIRETHPQVRRMRGSGGFDTMEENEGRSNGWEKKRHPHEIQRAWERLKEVEKQAHAELEQHRTKVMEMNRDAEQLRKDVQEAEEQVRWMEKHLQGKDKHPHTRTMERKDAGMRYEQAKDAVRPWEKRIAGIEKRIQEQERNTKHKMETRKAAMQELETQLSQRIANLKLKVDAKFETFQDRIRHERTKQVAELKEMAARNLTETLHPTLQAASEEINVTLEAFAGRVEDKERNMKQAATNMPQRVQEEVEKQAASLEPQVVALKRDNATRLRSIDLDLLTAFERDVRRQMEDLCEKVALIQAQDTDAIESIGEQVAKLKEDVSRTQHKLEQVASAIEDGTLQPSAPPAPPEDGEDETLRVLEELKRKLRFCSTRLEQELRQLHDVSMHAR